MYTNIIAIIEAAFGNGAIPWAAIASAPSEYFDTEKFDVSFDSTGLASFQGKWHALGSILVSGAGEGTLGFFRKVSAAVGEKEAEAEAEHVEREKQEQERVESEQQERQRVESQRLEQERVEREKQELERVEAERVEQMNGDAPGAGAAQDGKAKKGAKKRKAEIQLVPEDAGPSRRSGRTRQTAEVTSFIENISSRNGLTLTR